VASDLPGVVSSWHQLIEEFQTSPQGFYQNLESVIERRSIPGLSYSRVIFSEHGLGTSQREYLRIRRGNLIFDVCAAPFGSGFFFSWWLSRRIPPWGPIYIVLVTITALLLLRVLLAFLDASLILSILLTVLLYPLMLWLVTMGGRETLPSFEEAVLAVPVLGPLYYLTFRPVTYFQMDTAIMFRTAVHAAVLEVIDSLTEAKGVRALSESERKPIMPGLLGG